MIKLAFPHSNINPVHRSTHTLVCKKSQASQCKMHIKPQVLYPVTTNLALILIISSEIAAFQYLLQNKLSPLLVRAAYHFICGH